MVIGYVSNAVTQTVPAGGGRTLSETRLDTFDQGGQPAPMAFDVAVIC